MTSRRRTSRKIRANDAASDAFRVRAAHHALQQVSKLHNLVIGQIDAAEAARRERASFTKMAILHTRVAKTFDRIAAAYRRSAAAGGRRFFVGQTPGSGEKERRAAADAAANAAHHRGVANFYRTHTVHTPSDPRPKSRALKSNRRASRRIRANARARTFQEAKRDVIALLKSRGWSVRDGLKVPHATSPDGAVRLWFKTQAVHRSHGNASLGDARSVGYDIRFMPPEEFVTKVESFARRAY